MWESRPKGVTAMSGLCPRATSVLALGVRAGRVDRLVTMESSLATANPEYPALALAKRGLERKQTQNNWERSKNHRSLMNKAKRLPSDAIQRRQKKKERKIKKNAPILPRSIHHSA